MKNLMRLTIVWVVWLCGCGLIPIAQGAEFKNADAFLSEIKAAITQRDAKKLHQLTYEVGMTESDKAQLTGQYQEFLFQNTNIDSIAFVALPKSFRLVNIGQGKRKESTNAILRAS